MDVNDGVRYENVVEEQHLQASAILERKGIS